MRRIKKILIVALIFVVTLNINYLGMMDKRIIVKSKEYKEGNNNLVLNKILSDNELKQEIPHMFNYTSEGVQDSGGDVNLDYVTNGLYSNSDEDRITYYYRGNINNNNLVFGAYDEDYYVYGNALGTGFKYYQSKESCIEAGNSDEFCVKTKLASAGEKMYWKIIRVNGNGSFSSDDRLDQALNNFAKDNAPSFICPDTSESYGGSYRLKAGLITADELVYAGESFNVPGNSYLNSGGDGLAYWSMTPYSSEFVCGPRDQLLLSFIYSYSGIRPVINISTENMTLTGDGTLDNSYILEEVEPTNSYKGKVTIEVGSSIDDVSAFEEELNLSRVNWTVEDESIAKIDNGKIIGLKNGTTVITGVGSDGTSYEIEVTVISNPVTSSVLYIGIGLILILILGTGVYIFYRVRRLD